MCGIGAVYGRPDAATLVRRILEAEQHRGQASAGVVSSGGEHLYSFIGMGRVEEVFLNKELSGVLPGQMAIGHNRYPTTGGATLNNAQPFVVQESHHGPLAIAHNGNLVNTAELRQKLQDRGVHFKSTTDTEALLHLIGREPRSDFVSCCTQALAQAQGAYSLVLLRPHEMFAIRDPHGFWPLSWGEMEGGGYAVASETYALAQVGVRFSQQVAPGEIVSFSARGVTSRLPLKVVPSSACVFEKVYFAHPNSEVFGHVVWEVREELGRQLAREAPVRADAVVPVLNSGLYAALGFSKQSGIPLVLGLERNPHVGRTFIEPKDRAQRVGMKFRVRSDLVFEKSIVVVDDSLVRGTTMSLLVAWLLEGGAREVHVRIASARIEHPCFYGINTATQEELIAAGRSVAEVGFFVRAKSLAYLSYEGMMRVMQSGHDTPTFCSACFNGVYPVPLAA